LYIRAGGAAPLTGTARDHHSIFYFRARLSVSADFRNFAS
jgi:hypothetical protein